MSVLALRPTAVMGTVVHLTDLPPLSFSLKERPLELLSDLSREMDPCSAR